MMNFSKIKLFMLLLIGFSIISINGCGPSKDQIKNRNDVRGRAMSAIQGAKDMIKSAEDAGAQKFAQEELTQAKKTLSEAENLFNQGELKSNWNKNKKACLEAIDLYVKAEKKAGDAYQQAKTALDKTRTKSRVSKALEDAKNILEKAKKAEAETLAAKEFANAQTALKDAEELYYNEKYADSEVKAKEAIKLAQEAEEKARKERIRLDDLKRRLDNLSNKVKQLQDELARAIKDKLVKKVAKLMIELTDAEIDLAKEKYKEGIDTKQSLADIEKYENENKELRDLEKRLYKALENEAEALQKLEKIKKEREEIKREKEREENKAQDSEKKLEQLENERKQLEKERSRW